jgi:hypothetical protein
MDLKYRDVARPKGDLACNHEKHFAFAGDNAKKERSEVDDHTEKLDEILKLSRDGRDGTVAWVAGTASGQGIHASAISCHPPILA